MTTKPLNAKIVFFILLLMSVFSSYNAYSQVFSARLSNIRYYDDGIGGDYPLLVRICFVTNSSNPKSLTFVSRYSNDVVRRVSVSEFDSIYVYYSFRSKLNQLSTMDLSIEDRHGISCPIYTINCLPTNDNVVKLLNK